MKKQHVTNDGKIKSLAKDTSEFFQYKHVKKILDVLFSALACIIIFLIVAPAILIALLIEDQNGLIFKQKRIGFKGNSFYIYKFRTMSKYADQKRDEIRGKSTNGFLQCPNDHRVTKVGRFLRKTSTDELPQFLNVLRGEMSLIGPRPLIDDDVKQLSAKHLRRFEVMPGITGYAQINGRSIANKKNREQNDLYYIDNMSFSLDVRIFLKTLIVLFKKKEVY